jgi:hypothetical protein
MAGSDLISKKTRYEFREHLVGWTLREIEMEFDSADIRWDSEYVPQCGGQRRSLVEQYYHTVDFSDWTDVERVLRVFAAIIDSLPEDDPVRARLLKHLRRDGFEYEDGRLGPQSGLGALAQLKTTAAEFDAVQLHQQIERIERSLDSDPALAVGSAKELVETCCRTILTAHGEVSPGNQDVTKLVKATMKHLQLLPEGVPDAAKGAETIRRMLSNLATLVQGLAELRNLYGSGHGKDGRARGLQPRHARLASGAATTLAVFLFDTYTLRRPNQAAPQSPHEEIR